MVHFQSNANFQSQTDISKFKSNKTEPDADWNQGSGNLKSTRLLPMYLPALLRDSSSQEGRLDQGSAGTCHLQRFHESSLKIRQHSRVQALESHCFSSNLSFLTLKKWFTFPKLVFSSLVKWEPWVCLP